MNAFDDFTTALAEVTGLPATRERGDVLTRCLYVGAPTITRRLQAGYTVELPVWLIAEGTGTKAETDWLLAKLETVLEALGTNQATPEPYGVGEAQIPAYRMTAVLNVPRS